MQQNYLLAIGVNTGNSLDAVDVVLTQFGTDGSIVDLSASSMPMPNQLADCLRQFRKAVVDSEGEMQSAIACYEQRARANKLPLSLVNDLIAKYTLYACDAVNELAQRAPKELGLGRPIDVVGFHGQTCAHQPPSIAKAGGTTYTLQIGDGQLLANETGLPVVFDFRSDDLMNGGEGAPLAPVHHEHLARHLRERGNFPIAFCNAGNTGNISIITEHPDKKIAVLGWDVGPFNEYPDKLVQAERNIACDVDGNIGSKGTVNPALLRLLFDRGAVTDHGENFLLQPPPKSSDPQWYRLLPELKGEASIGTKPLAFEDRLRTAEYFAAYVYFYTLRWIADDLIIPTCFALCGGGWNNPISRGHFENLLHGEFDAHPILEEHKQIFLKISDRLRKNGKAVEVAMADEFGFSGQYMEARLFADAAVHRIMGEPFSRPETTGCRTPTVLGILRYPHQNPALASARLKAWLSKYNSANLTLDKPDVFDARWSRAARGWESSSKTVTKA